MGALHRTSGILLIIGSLGLMACTQAVTPTPTAAPAPAKAATKAPATAAPAATPASTPQAKPSGASPAAGPAKAAASSDWKAEWDKTLAAAKKEGKLVVSGSTGQPYRDALSKFQKAYPEIQLEINGMQGSQFATKVITERDGGQYLWDVNTGGGTTMNSRLKPKGVLAPLKPALILPEVLDEKAWLGGFEDGWADKENKYIYQFAAYLNDLFSVNRDFVPESELSKVDQLLEPKWKGKIVSRDLYAPGPSGTSVGWLLLVKGEDWLRKFYSQDLVIVKDGRSQMEGVVRGRYPIAYGGNDFDLIPFRKEGLGKNIVSLDADSEAGARLTGGSGFVNLIDKAPHPNAAKIFINWLLSKEGQRAYVDAIGYNSRRLDTPGGKQRSPNPNVKYRRLEREDLYPNVARANNIAKEMIK